MFIVREVFAVENENGERVEYGADIIASFETEEDAFATASALIKKINLGDNYFQVIEAPYLDLDN